ncbi:MAG: hypothetical protein EA352_02055 [Gemmatimonadales bacterium]|nr:MAG: hypothetical protein EA352_02055 [Gemmatimonadales bacterium]
MHLAGRVLTDWRRHPVRSPVNVGLPEVRHAFLHGALAPDSGFVPGTDRTVSELAHYIRPADLARALLAEARSETDEAFAWGWFHHVVVDVDLHPLVGRGVGELLHGDRNRRVDAMEDEAVHVALEVGLDVRVLQGYPAPRPPRGPHLSDVSVEQLRRALRHTYGVELPSEHLLAEHRRASGMVAWWPRLLQVVAAGRGLGMGPRRHPLLARALSAARRPFAEGTAPRGFLEAFAPRAWILEEFEEASGGFAHRFGALVEGGVDGFENRNLETGVVTGRGSGHPATDRAWERLEGLAGASP